MAKRLPIICSQTAKSSRPAMEDYVVNWNNGHIYIMGTCDGHGGKYISQELPAVFARLGKNLNSTLFKNSTKFKAFITKSFIDIDEWLINKLGKKAVESGSTVCIGFYDANTCIFYGANLGDSRALFIELNKKNPLFKTSIMEITKDHKPNIPEERKRIEAAGGFVETSGPKSDVPRVNGTLALSRALGDWSLKKGFNGGTDHHCGNVVDIYGPRFLDDISKTYSLLFFSDGVADVMKNSELRRLVIEKEKQFAKQSLLLNEDDVQDVCKEIVETSLARWKKLGSGDNVSVVIVYL